MLKQWLSPTNVVSFAIVAISAILFMRSRKPHAMRGSSNQAKPLW